MDQYMELMPVQKNDGEVSGSSEEEDSEEDDEGSEEGSNSGSSESEEGDSDCSDSEDDEPVLKYRRFAKDVVASNDGAVKICSIAVHAKFIALGTMDGSITLLDHTGTILKERVYHLHSDTVNQIAVDEDGEYIASCSDDRKVIIMGLFSTKYYNISLFETPVKALALHPQFSKSTNHVIVVGNERLVMIEERRWFGGKTHDIHGGGGQISTIKWKKNLIAWANQKAVLVFDTSTKEMITSISFEEEISNVPCCLFWKSPETLLVGRGHLVKIATVRDGDGHESSTTGDLRKKFMAITAQNLFPDFLVCGVVPIWVNENDWKLVVLGYSGNINQNVTVTEGTVPPPHLIVVSPGEYILESSEFDNPEPDAKDKLLPRGHNLCKCEEYNLDCVLGDDHLYITTPVDIILAERRGPEDHIEWLLTSKRDFEGAVKYAENPEVARQISPDKLKDIGVNYIYYLMKMEKFSEAAIKCSQVLGSSESDRKRWEDVIFTFYTNDVVDEIRPYIPLREPELSAAVYEVVLHYFLRKDCALMYRLLREWPTHLYDTQVIVNAVDTELRKKGSTSELLKVKAHLHEELGQYDEALKIYIQFGHPEVFQLILDRKLYSALLENLIPLFQLDTQKAVKVLIECKEDISPMRVVKELDLLGREEFLHKYLDAMFDWNPKYGSEFNFHQRQVELYAKYDKDKLLLFLRSCNDIPLQKALEVCEHYERWEEMVYLLGRMGNPKAALELIINKLQDVQKAIDFATEEDDAELWDVLINMSISQPRFITGLLNNVGTHIDPTKLIKKIPNKTEIPSLGRSLVKLMQDFRIQVNLREGCKKILVKDSHSLMEKLVTMQKKAVYIDDDSYCKTCGGETVGVEENTEYVVFFCGHIYHRRCVSKKNEMMLCRHCFAGAALSKKSQKQRRLLS